MWVNLNQTTWWHSAWHLLGGCFKSVAILPVQYITADCILMELTISIRWFVWPAPTSKISWGNAQSYNVMSSMIIMNMDENKYSTVSDASLYFDWHSQTPHRIHTYFFVHLQLHTQVSVYTDHHIHMPAADRHHLWLCSSGFWHHDVLPRFQRNALPASS